MTDVELFGQKERKRQICIQDAKTLIERGLKYFFGDKMKWLPEYEQIADWLSDNKGKGLLLIGDAGRGKTFLADKILTPIIKKKCPYDKIAFIRGYSMGADYDDSLGTILIIDDAGVEREQNIYGEKRNIFCQIVYDAELFNRLLIITTNLTIEELKDKYGDRIIDRLKALTTPVLFKGESMRNK